MSNAKDTKKTTGLASFSPTKTAPLAAASEAAPLAEASTSKPKEPEAQRPAKSQDVQKERMKQFPMRLTVNQWRHLKDLATFEEKTLLQITFEGCNMLLKSKGLKTLDEV